MKRCHFARRAALFWALRIYFIVALSKTCIDRRSLNAKLGQEISLMVVLRGG
jgi:hypothetical protein